MTSIATALKDARWSGAAGSGASTPRRPARSPEGTAIYRLLRWAQRNAAR
jgi:hypothetical protein